MAFTVTQKNLYAAGVDGGAYSTRQVTLNSIAAGALIVIAVNYEGASTTTSVSDGTTTATALTQKSHGNGDVHTRFFYYLSHAGGTKTFTLTLGAARSWIDFHVWEINPGGATVEFASEPAGGGGAGTSTAPNSGSMTTTQANGCAVGFYGEYSAATVSNPLISGAAADDSQGAATTARSWFKALSSTLNGAASCTLSSSESWVCGGAAFQEVAGGGTESISGTSAGTSTDSGAATQEAAISGTSAGTSTDTGAAAPTQDIAGSSPGTSTDSGNIDVHVEGTATSAGTSLDTGSITARAALLGTSAGTSADSGALTEESDVEQLTGTSAGTSTDAGAVSARAALSGTSAGTSTDSAGGTVTARISSSSPGTSLDTGALAALAALGGTSGGTSLDTGTLRDGSIPLVPSQTSAAAARDFTSATAARPRVWVAPARD